MLELIVLGQVPGTHFQITLSWVLAVSAVLLGTVEVRNIYRRRSATPKAQLKKLLLKLKRLLKLKLIVHRWVKYFGHRVAVLLERSAAGHSGS